MLTVKAYVGDGAVLLALDLEEADTANLAGFAIKCIAPVTGPYPTNEHFLKNNLNFNQGVTGDKQLGPANLVDSDQAPFQMFHWVHFPSVGPGRYTYVVYASYFENGNVKLGPSTSVDVDLSYESYPGLKVGFTRGYISSQAYADRFGNKPLVPAQRSMDFNTTPYVAQYDWLGAHARELVFDFLQECQQDPSITVDVFSYDFDEPDIIRALCQLGSRVRVFQDDASLHVGSALEPQTVQALAQAGASVKTGHFNRFAHDKVIIQKKNGNAVKVLTGSANFSVRGLYVQSNSVLVFEDPEALLYEQAFEEAFNNMQQFKSSAIASKWFDLPSNATPATSVSFAPHQTAFSLDKVADSINAAKSSVFFAVMEMAGGGRVMDALKSLGDRQELFSLGTIQSSSQLGLFRPGIDANTAVTSFDFLLKNVPEPFKTEWRGGAGQVIHHKFVVCDFNDWDPIVFCGSSNLSSGGEISNGDNLIAISDRRIATYYAVEAIRLFDHYRFRSLHEQSTSSNPLLLTPNDSWIKPYYDPTNIKSHERRLLSGAS